MIYGAAQQHTTKIAGGGGGVTVGGRLAVGDVRWLPGRGIPPATATGHPGAEWEHLAIAVILYSVLF